MTVTYIPALSVTCLYRSYYTRGLWEIHYAETHDGSFGGKRNKKACRYLMCIGRPTFLTFFLDTPSLRSLHYCTTVSLPIITVTAASRSIEIHIVLTRNTFDIIPPTPAPIAKNRMILKKWHALIRDDLS